ncbi:hypothetical protein I553_1163 [Mycobacterium xenopi 4042]|uniref:Uncharacterized protein n=1 Tax=Mycobacterium xenopi 4042 TaxID=1299334 RepID=X7ZBR5_MYCXE|nr:hypothetical protein I553_1163 [Mycobacterium xenopi 4042]
MTPKIAAAPSNRPTTTLAAAGATNRFIGGSSKMRSWVVVNLAETQLAAAAWFSAPGGPGYRGSSP